MEASGFTVEWDENAKIVKMTKEDVIYEYDTIKHTIYRNGVDIGGMDAFILHENGHYYTRWEFIEGNFGGRRDIAPNDIQNLKKRIDYIDNIMYITTGGF